MPRKDETHEAFKNALIKDGCAITDDPFRMVIDDADVYAVSYVLQRRKSSPSIVASSRELK